ncbi:MAG: HmuY family protein, partial [Myxococcota bacterium]
MKRTTLLLTLAPLGLACGEDAADPVGGMPAESPETPSLITTTDSGSQKESNIDSTDGEAWVFISFRAGGVQVEVSDPMADAGWDVGFRRSNVRVNGGASGSGNGAVALIAGTTFDEVSRAPAMGWLTDEAEIEMGPDGSPVMNDGVDFAFTRAQGDDAPNGWFSYNPATHVL